MVFRPTRLAALALALAPLAAAAEDAPTAATAVATVNGAPVELGDLIAVRSDLPEQYQQLPDEALYDGLRKQLIDQRILSDAAEKAGAAELPGVARELALQRANYLANRYIREEVGKRVTEERISAAYQARFVDVEPVQEVRASHILVEEKELADTLRAELDGGADFAELAKEHGSDSTKTRGGDLGWFAHEAMVPEFADAAFAIETEGEIAGPVRTNFGWHLIKLTGKRDKPAPTLDEVRAELKNALSEEAAAELIEELRAAAEVETPEDRPGLSGLRDDALLAQ